MKPMSEDSNNEDQMPEMRARQHRKYGKETIQGEKPDHIENQWEAGGPADKPEFSTATEDKGQANGQPMSPMFVTINPSQTTASGSRRGGQYFVIFQSATTNRFYGVIRPVKMRRINGIFQGKVLIGSHEFDLTDPSNCPIDIPPDFADEFINQ